MKTIKMDIMKKKLGIAEASKLEKVFCFVVIKLF
jgi:hypothetical protein